MGLDHRRKTGPYPIKGLQGHANGNWCCAIPNLYILMFTFVQTHEQYKNAPNTHHWHWLICCLWNVCISQWETGGRNNCCHDNRHKLAIRRGRGKQESNKCQWVVDGDIYDVGRWTQFTTGNIHRYKPENYLTGR